MQKHVTLVDLVEIFPANSKEYLLAKVGFDAAENEPLGIGNLDGNLGIWRGENSKSNSQIPVGIGTANCGVSFTVHSLNANI